MRVVRSSTVLGKRLISIGTKWEGIRLHEVYHKCSDEKEKAWNRCYDEYLRTEGSTLFSICSHNNFSFTVSWFTSEGMRLETSKNSYIVIFDE